MVRVYLEDGDVFEGERGFWRSLLEPSWGIRYKVSRVIFSIDGRISVGDKLIIPSKSIKYVKEKEAK